MLSYLPQPLPFYDVAVRQHARICPGSIQHAFQATYNFDTDTHYLEVPQFHIRRAVADGGGSVSAFRLHSIKYGMIFEAPVSSFSIHALDGNNELEAIVHTATEYGYVFNGQQELMDAPLFWEVVDASQGYVSETFTLRIGPADCDRLLKIKWKTSCLLEGAYWNDPAGFELVIDASVGKPKYIYEEDGDTDRLGTFRPAWKRIEKEYEVELKAPEHIADALAYTAMFSEVTVHFENTLGYGNVRDIRTEAEWDADGCLATVRWRFRADFVFKTACC